MTVTPQPCPRCETLPSRLQGPGKLFLQFPISHSRGKLLGYLRKSGIEFAEDGDTLSFAVGDADVGSLVAPLMDVLSTAEQADARALFQRDGQILVMSDYFGIQPLNAFLARAQSAWLLEMMEEKRLTSWFQPIVHCDGSDKIFAYECLLRGVEDDKLVFPKRIFDVARGSGLLFQLDRTARIAALEAISVQNLNTRAFINFVPAAIYDPVNCLKSTVEATDRLGIAHDRVVFEVVESEHVADTTHLKNILGYYRDHGFGIALDDVGSGYSSLNMLSALRPNYIKIDRELTTRVHSDPYKATIVRKLLETARDLGILSIAEGIEEADEVSWLRENGADFVQGYYYARPSPTAPRTVPPL